MSDEFKCKFITSNRNELIDSILKLQKSNIIFQIKKRPCLRTTFFPRTSIFKTEILIGECDLENATEVLNINKSNYNSP